MRFVIIFVVPNPSIFLAPAVSAAKVKAYADWGGWRLHDMKLGKYIAAWFAFCSVIAVAAIGCIGWAGFTLISWIITK